MNLDNIIRRCFLSDILDLVGKVVSRWLQMLIFRRGSLAWFVSDRCQEFGNINFFIILL